MINRVWYAHGCLSVVHHARASAAIIIHLTFCRILRTFWHFASLRFTTRRVFHIIIHWSVLFCSLNARVRTLVRIGVNHLFCCSFYRINSVCLCSTINSGTHLCTPMRDILTFLHSNLMPMRARFCVACCVLRNSIFVSLERLAFLCWCARSVNSVRGLPVRISVIVQFYSIDWSPIVSFLAFRYYSILILFILPDSGVDRCCACWHANLVR